MYVSLLRKLKGACSWIVIKDGNSPEYKHDMSPDVCFCSAELTHAMCFLIHQLLAKFTLAKLYGFTPANVFFCNPASFW